MLNRICIILAVFLLLGINSALAKETSPVVSSQGNNHKTVISMTHEQVLDFAKDLIVQGKLDDARKPDTQRQMSRCICVDFDISDSSWTVVKIHDNKTGNFIETMTSDDFYAESDDYYEEDEDFDDEEEY